jgi:peptidoglycan/LPS O-acetylase OafA/YrhL
MNKQLEQLKYIKELDGMRAIAVLLVIIAHWFPVQLVNEIGFGSIGVEMFFVRSGFWITRILLIERFRLESKEDSRRWPIIRTFMARRALRIFPIYYLLLLGLILIRDFFPNPVFSDFGWYFFYVQNILVFKLQAWPAGKLSHLWTLAVEEQVYLIWPIILIFSPLRLLKYILIFFLCFGAANYILLDNILIGISFTDVLIVTCIQGFAVGGLLAYFHLKGTLVFKQISKWFILLGLFAFVFFLLAVFKIIPLFIGIRFYVDSMASGLIAFLLISDESLLKKYFLGNPVLVGIGKISYGIYLFHNFIPVLWNAFLKLLSNHGFGFPYVKYHPILATQNLVFYLQCFLILILLTTSSFYLYEKPIMKLKERWVR